MRFFNGQWWENPDHVFVATASGKYLFFVDKSLSEWGDFIIEFQAQHQSSTFDFHPFDLLCTASKIALHLLGVELKFFLF